MLALLDDGRITQLVAGLRACQRTSRGMLGLANKQADYFERNAERMNYPQYRSQGLFVGSGVIEAGCKTVVAQRLKRSGMFWTVRGANAILALRCCRLNGNIEDDSPTTGCDANGFRTAARFGTPFAAAPAFECWPIMAFQRSQRAL